jgi:tetratricopeptide (TPR) repeat protein
MFCGSCVGIALMGIGLAEVNAEAQSPSAESLIGAEKALLLIQKGASRKIAENENNPAAQQARKIREDLKLFTQSRSRLSPVDAAAQWLALYDRFWALPPSFRQSQLYRGQEEDILANQDPVALISLLDALPGPEAWTELNQLVAHRTVSAANFQREMGLKLLAAYLQGDMAQARKVLESLIKKVDGLQEYRRESAIAILQAINSALCTREQALKPVNVAEQFRTVLATVSAGGAARPSVDVAIPDLVALVGRNSAEELIRETLKITNVYIGVRSGADTKALVQQVIVQNLDQIMIPQWNMVCTIDTNALALFEALNAKFPSQKTPALMNLSAISVAMNRMMSSMRGGPPSGHDRGQNTARQYYVASLLVAGRMDDALKALDGLSSEQLQQDVSAIFHWVRQGRIPHARAEDMVDQLLAKTTDASVAASLITGIQDVEAKKQEWVVRMETIAGDAAEKPRNRWLATYQLYRLNLANDNLAAALQALNRGLALNLAGESDTFRREAAQRQQEIGLSLANMGRLLQRQDLIAQGMALMEESGSQIRQLQPDGGRGYADYFSAQKVQVLIELERYAEAQALSISNLAGKVQMGAADPYDYSGFEAARELTQLVAIYDKVQRVDDILVLIDKAPWWNVKDLQQIPNYAACGEGAILHVVVAKALNKQGRSPEAVRILKYVLMQNPGADSAYQILVDIEGKALLPWLDQLYARDRFEERPLIWKAVILKNSGQLADAEATVRQALKVDPTDGEQPAGDRVRAYAVLGDILAAQGKKDDAQFFRNVVESVRLAEKGDQFFGLGMIQHSLALYEQAQVLFADAYCVQWRLARRLTAQGKDEEAEKHYRIAFERMPEQFGQVASLCFGCEGIFETLQTRSVAETVLLDLEKKAPPRPQTYYLLAQLREAQERLPEAHAYLKKAIELDPGYLDAWRKRVELAPNLFLPQGEKDALYLTVLKMDPLQRHASAQLGDIYDLKGLWNQLAVNQEFTHTPEESLLPFATSKKKLEDQEKTDSPARRIRSYRSYRYDRMDLLKPAAGVCANAGIQQILALMANEDLIGGSDDMSFNDRVDVIVE